MAWTQALHGEHFTFYSVKQVLARASEARSGDEQAQVAAGSLRERAAAKLVLAERTLRELREAPSVPYEQDEVTRVIEDGHCDPRATGSLRHRFDVQRALSSRSAHLEVLRGHDGSVGR